MESAVTSGLVDILDPDGPVAAWREQLSLLLRPGSAPPVPRLA
jgi:hypothetical protein